MTLFALALTAACQDLDTEPLLVEAPFETSVDEASLDLAGSEVSDLQDQLVRDAQRDRARDRRHPRVDRIGLIVELGATAVSLAERLIDGQGADREQLRLLQQAKEYLRLAKAALRSDDPERAVHFAIQACWTALKAVVLPGGVTEEEERMIHELATDLIQAAVAAVGDDPTGLEKLLLQWSAQFYAAGVELLESGQVRGVAWLWKSAVISTYIIG